MLVASRRVDLQPVQVRRSRRLSSEGHVVVQSGQVVEPAQVVARGPGRIAPLLIDLASELEVGPREAARFLQHRPGDSVGKEQVLATRAGPLGIRPRVVRAPVAGVIRGCLEATGELLFVPNGQSEEVRALFPGIVVDVIPRWGVVVGFRCIRAEGLVGIGRTVSGPLVPVGERADHALRADDLGPRVRQGIVLVGCVTADVVVASFHARVQGIMAGSIRHDEWEKIARLDERPSVVILEGFGEAGLSSVAWNGLRAYAGYEVILDAARQHPEASWPELLIPVEAPAEMTEVEPLQLSPGVLVRVRDSQGAARVAEVVRVGQYPAHLSSGHRERWVDVLVAGRRLRVSQRSIELVAVAPIRSDELATR